MKTFTRIPTQSMGRSAALSQSFNQARALAREVSQYGKRKPAPTPKTVTILNKTQGRRITYA